MALAFSFRHDGGEDGHWKREEGKARVVDQTAAMTEQASTPLSICLSDPQGQDEAVAQEGAQNSVKKGVHFGTPSIEGERAREPRGAHPSLTLAHPGSPCSQGASV